MTTDIAGFLGGKVASASFPDREYGTTVGGRIIRDPELMQQRDYTTGDPLFYPDSGKPQMQLVVHVQTDVRDPAVPDDDGVRALYVKGQMRAALIDALRRAGIEPTVGPRKGGQLFMRYERDEPVTLKNGKRGNPQKIYTGKYLPPAGEASEFLTEPSNAPASFANGPQPTTSADAMRNSGNVPQALPCPEGIEPARWAAMTPGQQTQMYSALGLDPNTPPF